MTHPQCDLEESIKAVAMLMRDTRSSYCVALTGTGISAESGSPTFRSREGLWEKCDSAFSCNSSIFCVMLVIITSAKVYNTAALPDLARQKKGAIIEINIERAFPYVDYFMGEKAGVVLPKIVGEIKKMDSFDNP